MLSRFFIDRPVFSIVLSLLIVIAGGVSIVVLPVERYPEITPPQVQITAVYPGADAQTLAESVAAPIEQQLSGIKNLIYFSSQSSNDGTCKITVTFEIGTDQDMAAVEVQNRLAIAQPKLPQEVVRNGVTVVKASSSILALVALESNDENISDLFLSNYATINLLDRIKRVPGVGDASVFGNRDYSMRIWVNPDRLALKGMTVSDVTAALRDQNAVFPAGMVGQRPTGDEVELTLPVLTRGRLSDVSDYEDVILRATPDGAIVRLKDVARIELGAQSYNMVSRLNGKPTTLILINLQSGANALATMDNILATMKEAEQDFPAGISWSIPFETTSFVSESVEKVIHTLFEAILLVIVVVFLFLQSWRATLIPLLAVPVAVIGTFAGMIVLGFSINTLTLFGLVLAIGIVVDDAIVVVENVERIMHEDGLSPRDATIKAMQQVTGPVIAIVLVLSAVFVPVTFLGGFTGQMYRQFAVTIALSVAISGLVALTLSPALASILLLPSHGKKNILFRAFDKVFDWITFGYVSGVKATIHMTLVTLITFGVLCYATYRLSGVVPAGFLPDEDQGYVIGVVMLPDGSSLDKTQSVIEQGEEFFKNHPAVDNVVGLVGYDVLGGGAASTNAGVLFVRLKPFHDREEPELSAQALIADSQQLMLTVTDGLILTINPPPIQGLGQRAGFTIELQQRGGGSVTELADVTQKFLAAANEHPDLVGLNATLRVTLPQVFVDLNREKTRMMGVELSGVFEPMQAYFGSLYVNDFNRFGRIWRVQVQAEPEVRNSPTDIDRIYVRNNIGKMVPLSAIVDTKFQAGPNLVSRYNGFPAVEITGAPAVGISSGQAMNTIRQLAADTLPPGYGIEWSGASYQEIKAGNQAPMVLLFGLVVVFLVLAAQYERWTLPVGVLLAVPLAVLGALIAVYFRGYTQDIYFQIGLLTLVGLSAKNAILIVEFCVALRKEGMGIVDAAVEAAKLRFRPIVMTSLAFILGVVPLAIATGAGAAGRRSLGTGVVGGMLSATFLAIFFIPLFYVLIQRMAEFFSGSRAVSPSDDEAAHGENQLTSE
ncbi:multidrug efflux RND transporter permease subunit [Bremerella cremea]|uniref:Multidrug efflux RND transporter permease subunit n=1 Tax=Bremerella cremea TaxID=1031537 RepID=A0A368KSQ6_9BACT|nr:multidrug efflux RND transporter permease subunit [Bremerella cremea]RCS51918.1 multidrug efflux RND transporter permease subunit [Bremerella cremea]